VRSKKGSHQRLNFIGMLCRQPGDEFEIKLGWTQARFVPVGGKEGEE
jgi:hypothetical protein